MHGGFDSQFRFHKPHLHYSHYAVRLKRVIFERLSFFNNHYGFIFKRISVKDVVTCWGSCSNKKNLNFNYRLFFLPSELLDYVVVHELCHIAVLNHSPDFWKLVARALPDFQKRRRLLRRYRWR